MHGGPTTLHERPCLSMAFRQQLSIPPGLPPQSLPPHTLHEAAQHVLWSTLCLQQRHAHAPRARSFLLNGRQATFAGLAAPTEPPS